MSAENRIFSSKHVLVEQEITRSDRGRPQDLVGIGRADSSASGSDGIVTRVLRKQFLQCAIEHLVMFQHEVASIGDVDAGLCIDSSTLNRVDLFDEFHGIDDHAVSDHTLDVRIQDPRRDQVQCVFRITNDHGMSGVGASVVPDHHVMSGGQKIDDLALAFVTPLKSDDRGVSWQCLRTVFSCRHLADSCRVVWAGPGCSGGLFRSDYIGPSRS